MSLKVSETCNLNASLNELNSHIKNYICKDEAVFKDLEEFKIIGELGQGAFGKVFLGKHELTGQEVAIKSINKINLSKEELDLINREIKFMTKLKNNANIIKIYQIIDSNSYLNIIMEVVKGGDLLGYIQSKGRLSEENSAIYFTQIVNALELIHSCNIVHRDIKPENMLLTEDKEMIKLTDFGLSNNCYKGQLLMTSCGSPFYAPPEMILNRKYNKSVDIWSLGVTLYHMLCGYLPFYDDNTEKLYKIILSCDLTFPNHLSTQAKDILKKLLTISPEKRITLIEIKKHPFYLSIKQNSEIKNHLNEVALLFNNLNVPIIEKMEKLGFKAVETRQSIKNGVLNRNSMIYDLLLTKQYQNTFLNNFSKKLKSNDKFEIKTSKMKIVKDEKLKTSKIKGIKGAKNKIINLTKKSEILQRQLSKNLIKNDVIRSKSFNKVLLNITNKTLFDLGNKNLYRSYSIKCKRANFFNEEFSRKENINFFITTEIDSNEKFKLYSFENKNSKMSFENCNEVSESIKKSEYDKDKNCNIEFFNVPKPKISQGNLVLSRLNDYLSEKIKSDKDKESERIKKKDKNLKYTTNEKTLNFKAFEKERYEYILKNSKTGIKRKIIDCLNANRKADLLHPTLNKHDRRFSKELMKDSFKEFIGAEINKCDTPSSSSKNPSPNNMKQTRLSFKSSGSNITNQSPKAKKLSSFSPQKNFNYVSKKFEIPQSNFLAKDNDLAKFMNCEAFVENKSKNISNKKSIIQILELLNEKDYFSSSDEEYKKESADIVFDEFNSNTILVKKDSKSLAEEIITFNKNKVLSKKSNDFDITTFLGGSCINLNQILQLDIGRKNESKETSNLNLNFKEITREEYTKAIHENIKRQVSKDNKKNFTKDDLYSNKKIDESSSIKLTKNGTIINELEESKYIDKEGQFNKKSQEISMNMSFLNKSLISATNLGVSKLSRILQLSQEKSKEKKRMESRDNVRVLPKPSDKNNKKTFQSQNSSLDLFNENFNSKSNKTTLNLKFLTNDVNLSKHKDIKNRNFYKDFIQTRSKAHIRVLLEILNGKFKTSQEVSKFNKHYSQGIVCYFPILKIQKVLEYIPKYSQLNNFILKEHGLDTFELIKNGVVLILQYESRKRSCYELKIKVLKGDKKNAIELVDHFLNNLDLLEKEEQCRFKL